MTPLDSLRRVMPFVFGLALILVLTGCSDKEGPEMPSIVVTPDAMVRSIAVGVGNPPAQQFAVRNDGDGVIRYNATTARESSWLTLFSVEVSVPDTFIADIRTGGMAAGTYYDTIIVSSDQAGNSPILIPVTLVLENVLFSEPSTLGWSLAIGDPSPEVDTLILGARSSTPASFTLSKSQPWLELSGTNGVTFDTVQVGANVTGLGSGLYFDTIRVESPDANSPIIVPCSLLIASWLKLPFPDSRSLRASAFTDDQHGNVVGVLQSGTGGGLMGRTTDGGQNWLLQFTDEALGDVQFVNDSVGWAVGAASTILYTTDSGKTWLPQGIELPEVILNAASFINEDTGYIVGNTGTILQTTDGSTWTDISQPIHGDTDYKGVHFVTSDSGWVVGNLGLIWLTSDAGATWTASHWTDIIDLWDVDFADNLNGWVVGEAGTILYTSDGGVSWTQQTSNVNLTLRSVEFANPMRGWVIGPFGTILSTEDGGTTWAEQPSGVSTNLNDVFFLDDATGWVVGEASVVLFTNGGGL